MGQLAELAKARSPYLNLETGESIVAVYKGYKMVPSTYAPDKENFRFILEIEVNGEKQNKFWDTGSNAIALVFDGIKEGEEVKITKSVIKKGDKEQTHWDAEPVKKEAVKSGKADKDSDIKEALDEEEEDKDISF